MITLAIADDGSSHMGPGDLTQLGSLGLPLVRDMARDQLRGSFRLYRAALPEQMRDPGEEDALWTIAVLVFPPERESIPGSS
jgi:hypothetical protein